MVIGGEYRRPDPLKTECALCHFEDDGDRKELDDDDLEVAYPALDERGSASGSGR